MTFKASWVEYEEFRCMCDRCKKEVVLGEQHPSGVPPREWVEVELPKGFTVTPEGLAGHLCWECRESYEKWYKEGRK